MADIVDFMMTHDGDPEPAFAAKVQRDNTEKLAYIHRIAKALSEEEYADDFFACTGKILRIPHEQTTHWAQCVAEEVLARTATVQ